MHNPHGFDYNQPNRDALTGIYVEVSDSVSGTPAAKLPASQEKPVIAQVEQLFGLTISVNDDTAERPSRTRQT
jgi:hypothetical protein